MAATASSRVCLPMRIWPGSAASASSTAWALTFPADPSGTDPPTSASPVATPNRQVRLTP